MKQLGRRLRDGKTFLLDVSNPVLGSGEVLVRNYYSCVSKGTEGATQNLAKKNLIGKALSRKDDVKSVIKLAKERGATQALDLVNSKLDEYGPVGYTSCGVIVSTGSDISDLSKGELVACAGVGFASHSELVAVPRNLCVKIDKNTDFRLASLNAIGSIAIQGIRLANVEFGGSAVIIGLGLIGQIVGNVLHDMSVSVYSLDLDIDKLDDSKSFSSFSTSERELLEKRIQKDFPHGVDSVIICAATKANGLLDFAGKLLRKNGDCVVVGDVPLSFNRNPFWYEKQLSLKLSTSYGPGRYDNNYEINGIDYPYGEVRWTSNRNMQAFQNYVYKHKEKLGYLLSEVQSFEKSPGIYSDIDNNLSKYAVVFEYAQEEWEVPNISNGSNYEKVINEREYSVIGAGNHFKSTLLPNLPKGLEPSLVMNKTGLSSQFMIDKYGFKRSVNNLDEFVGLVENNVIISSRHCDHFPQINALKDRPLNILLEKPFCIHSHELKELKDSYSTCGWKADLTLAYNRRFSSYTQNIINATKGSKVAISIEVNAGSMPENSPLLDPNIGGGRLIGEVCHFIDLAYYLSGSSTIDKASLVSSSEKDCSYVVTLQHRNESISTIRYITTGSKNAEKEKVFVYGGGNTFEIQDWRRLKKNGKIIIQARKQDKGHRAMLDNFFGTSGISISPTLEELFHTQEVLIRLNENGAF